MPGARDSSDLFKDLLDRATVAARLRTPLAQGRAGKRVPNI